MKVVSRSRPTLLNPSKISWGVSIHCVTPPHSLLVGNRLQLEFFQHILNGVIIILYYYLTVFSWSQRSVNFAKVSFPITFWVFFHLLSLARLYHSTATNSVPFVSPHCCTVPNSLTEGSSPLFWLPSARYWHWFAAVVLHANPSTKNVLSTCLLPPSQEIRKFFLSHRYLCYLLADINVPCRTFFRHGFPCLYGIMFAFH